MQKIRARRPKFGHALCWFLEKYSIVNKAGFCDANGTKSDRTQQKAKEVGSKFDRTTSPDMRTQNKNKEYHQSSISPTSSSESFQIFPTTPAPFPGQFFFGFVRPAQQPALLAIDQCFPSCSSPPPHLVAPCPALQPQRRRRGVPPLGRL